MATLLSDSFTAQLAYDLPNQRPDSTGAGHGLFYDDVQFPATVAAGDVMILGWLDNRYPLPELGRITGDGVGTALTIDVGYGEYNARTGVLTNTDPDAFVDGLVCASALSQGMADTVVPAGVFTRVTPSIGKPNEASRVVTVTAVAETGGELTSLSISLPASPVATS